MIHKFYLALTLTAVTGAGPPEDRESALLVAASIKGSELSRLHHDLNQVKLIMAELSSDLEVMTESHAQSSRFLRRDVAEGIKWNEALMQYASTVQPDWKAMVRHQDIRRALFNLPQSLPPPEEEERLRSNTHAFVDAMNRAIIRSRQSYKIAHNARHILARCPDNERQEVAKSLDFVAHFLRTLEWYERKLNVMKLLMDGSALSRDKMRKEVPKIWRTHLERRLQRATMAVAQNILSRSDAFQEGSDLASTTALTLAKFYHRSWHEFHSMNSPNLCLRSSSFALAILNDLRSNLADEALHPEVAIEIERNLMVSNAKFVALNVRCQNFIRRHPEMAQKSRDYNWSKLMQTNRNHKDMDCRTLFMRDESESEVDTELHFSRMQYRCQDFQPDA